MPLQTGDTMDENKKNNQDSSVNQKIREAKRQVVIAEESLAKARRALSDISGADPLDLDAKETPETKTSQDGRVIEGVFDGENMVGPEGKKYPVPANYASKSKLVEGDRLKLTIMDDGSFLFKQIAPVKRKNIIGILKFEDNAYYVLSEGRNYKVLYSSVTFHKGKPGDRVSVVVPAEKEASWAVIESVLHQSPSSDKPEPSPPPSKPEVAVPPRPEEKPETPKSPEADLPDEKEAGEKKENDSGPDLVEKKLGIEDISIKSPQKSEAPKAADPGSPRSDREQEGAKEEPPQKIDREIDRSISEMDI